MSDTSPQPDTKAPVEPVAATDSVKEIPSTAAPNEVAPSAPSESPVVPAAAAVAGAPADRGEGSVADKGEAKAPASESTPIEQLWTLAQSTAHPEIWGVTLADPASHVPTQIILQKYLNANDGDLAKAKDQLTKTLEWRAKTKPLEVVKKVFSKTKFDGLGYVTKYVQDGSTEPEGSEIFTWNIYGGVKSIDDTFGNLEE